jgi:MFS family permease
MVRRDGSHARRRGTLAVLCAADVLVALDATGVGVALPSIQDGLGFSATGLQWVVTAYTVSLGAFVLVGGRIADAAGPLRTLRAGLAVFAAGSLCAGLARDPALLVAARALAGLGAALAIPASLALLAAEFPRGPERTRAIGVVSAGIDAGMVLGAVLGGIVTSALGWPWVFLLAVPIAVATVAVAPRFLGEQRPNGRAARLDPLAAPVAATGLAALILALTRVEAHGVAAPATVIPLGAGVVLLAGFAALERRAADPLVPRAVLRRRRPRAANLAIVANAGAFGGLLVLSALAMQRVMGFGALEAGLGFIPLALSAAAGGPAAAPLAARFGAPRVVGASFVVTSAAMVWVAVAPEHTYAVALLPAFAVAGFTFATAAVPLTDTAVADAGPAEHGAAAGVFQTSTHAGGAAVLAVLVVAAAAWTRGVAADGPPGTDALAAGYRFAFALTAALLLAGAVLTAALLRERAD